MPAHAEPAPVRVAALQGSCQSAPQWRATVNLVNERDDPPPPLDDDVGALHRLLGGLRGAARRGAPRGGACILHLWQGVVWRPWSLDESKVDKLLLWQHAGCTTVLLSGQFWTVCGNCTTKVHPRRPAAAEAFGQLTPRCCRVLQLRMTPLSVVKGHHLYDVRVVRQPQQQRQLVCGRRQSAQAVWGLRNSRRLLQVCRGISTFCACMPSWKPPVGSNSKQRCKPATCNG